MELEDTNLNDMAGTSHKTVSQNSVVQYGDRENQNTEISEDECEEENWGREELYEEEYWEQSDPVKKGTKDKYTSECCNETDDNFLTYRRTSSKDQKERQLNKQYKLDKTTTLLLEELVGMRNIGPYYDAIGEGRNSIVIEVGTSVVRYTPTYSCTYRNAIKIYKLCNDDAKNKAIFQRTRREFHIHPIGLRYCKNIIIMKRIGTDDEPALKITAVPPHIFSELYYLITTELSNLFRNRWGRAHGNLSAKSILYWQQKPVFIGWAYTVCSDHPNALKKLMKDCYFVTKFFKRRGVPVKSAEELFKEITKLREISREVLDVMDKRKHKNQNCSRNDVQKLSGNSRFK